jgi:hypothetical protein
MGTSMVPSIAPRDLSIEADIQHQPISPDHRRTTNESEATQLSYTPHTYLSIMAVDKENPLISTQKSSDSGLQVALHPLVLLTISDYITRHTLRNQQGPVVGALLGQQNGREITIEHAFECLLLVNGDNAVVLHSAWFEDRLQQSKSARAQNILELD